MSLGSQDYRTMMEAERLMKEFILPGFESRFQKYLDEMKDLRARQDKIFFKMAELEGYINELRGVAGETLLLRLVKGSQDAEQKNQRPQG